MQIEIGHYKIKGLNDAIFTLYEDAMNYCYDNKISIDKIFKTKEY